MYVECAKALAADELRALAVSLHSPAGVPRCRWRGLSLTAAGTAAAFAAAPAASGQWRFQGRQKRGDKPGRLVGNKVKRVFLAHQGPKIAPVCQPGTLTLFLGAPETSFACCGWRCGGPAVRGPTVRCLGGSGLLWGQGPWAGEVVCPPASLVFRPAGVCRAGAVLSP